MDYLDWNNEIAQYFFNEENAEKEVYIFITKQQIIAIGKKRDLQGTDEEIFLDYVNAVKYPNDSSIHTYPIDSATFYHMLWKNAPNKYPFPLFIGYLALFIIPLFEKSTQNYRSDNYYDRVNDFFSQYNILSSDSVSIKTSNFKRIDPLWYSLEQWSIEQKNTELGYFEVHPFKNRHWVHVGKPLTQCILSEKAIRNLNKFYESSGIVPNEEMSVAKCRDFILDHGCEYLFLENNAISVISDKNNELGISIIKLVIRNYKEWKGETDIYDPDNETVIKGYTLAILKLCCDYDPINGLANLYYRLYSKVDYPEDLILEYNETTYKCSAQRRGWSLPISIPFSDELIMEDSTNKWKAKFPSKDIRILVAGAGYYLNDWIEVEYMSITATMLLLVKTELKDDIEDWGKQFVDGRFNRMKLNGLPEDYQLYNCKNPDIEHPDIPILSFKTDKRFVWNDGLKVSPRTYLPYYLPNIEIENGKGDETVVMKYDDDAIHLIRRESDQPIWDFPTISKLILNTKFTLKVKDQAIEGEKLRGRIYGFNTTQKSLDKYPDLIPRDIYGTKIERNVSEMYINGYEANGINYQKMVKYMMYFTPVDKYGQHEKIKQEAKDDTDLLLYYLSVKESCNAKDFYSTFESIYYEKFESNEIDEHKLSVATIKRWSLQYLNLMGFIDYEYSTKDIIIYPPQVIPVPTYEGRKAIFIGARTPKVCRKFINSIKSAGYMVNHESQDKTNTPFLLPNTISITAEHTQRYSFDSDIMNICNEHSIKFTPSKFPAFELAEFSGNLENYKNNLVNDDKFYPSGWKTQIFNAELMKFVNIDSEKINKDFSLIEYKLNEYTYKHLLWEKGKAYKIDKSWGRYIILNIEGKNVITYSRNPVNEKFCHITVPATVPIPEILNKSLICCSGKSPQRKFIDFKGNKIWCNIYNNIPYIFASNFLKKLGQKIIEKQAD